MSKRELARVEVLARVRSKQLRVVDAGRLMQVSYRQAKRLWKRYREEGAAGLQHRSAGRPSNHGHAKKFRQKVLGLVRQKYGGAVGERFGPTLAAEHLAAEDGLQVDAETLRRWKLAEGLWSRERRRRRHRRRRDRKEHFGELVQMDGSFHAWLEERGPEGCLIDMVDDATNTTRAQLGEQETIWAVADGLRAWIERYGVPLALYVDWKNLYKRPANARERLRGEEPITQFGRMNTTDALHGRPPGRRTITVARRGPRSWTGFSGWRANARLARTGWCGTAIGFFNSSGRAATMHQRRTKHWCARGGTATSPSNTAATRCAGGRLRRPASRRRSSGPARPNRRRPRGSGCRQRITRGEKPPAEVNRGER